MPRYILQYHKGGKVSIYKGTGLLKVIALAEVFNFLKDIEDTATVKIVLDEILAELAIFKKPKAKYQVVLWGNGMAGIYRHTPDDIIQVSNGETALLGLSITHNVPNNGVIKVLKGEKMQEFKKTRNMLTVFGKQY